MTTGRWSPALAAGAAFVVVALLVGGLARLTPDGDADVHVARAQTTSARPMAPRPRGLSAAEWASVPVGRDDVIDLASVEVHRGPEGFVARARTRDRRYRCVLAPRLLNCNDARTIDRLGATIAVGRGADGMVTMAGITAPDVTAVSVGFRGGRRTVRPREGLVMQRYRELPRYVEWAVRRDGRLRRHRLSDQRG